MSFYLLRDLIYGRWISDSDFDSLSLLPSACFQLLLFVRPVQFRVFFCVRILFGILFGIQKDLKKDSKECVNFLNKKSFVVQHLGCPQSLLASDQSSLEPQFCTRYGHSLLLID